jgi:photosystem II stability/assembly factor-like uncharacterized protein
MNRITFSTLILIFCIESLLSQNWVNVGPHNGNGPIIDDLIQDPVNPQILYAASNNEGIFKSLDKGESWVKISPNFITGQMNALAISPDNTAVIYTGGSGGKIYKSSDAGNNWEEISGNLPSYQIWDIEIMPGSNFVYVATAGPQYLTGGLFMTQDENNWVEISQDFANKKVNTFEINPSNPQIFYAGTEQNSTYGILYKSMNGGLNWTEILSANIIDLKVDPNNDQKIVAAAKSERIYISEDNGNTWTYYNGFPNAPNLHSIAINSYNSDEMLLACYASNYLNPGIYKSTDGGYSWFGSDNGMESKYVFSVLFDHQDEQNAFCGSKIGFHKSEDGGEIWETSIQGMRRLFIGSMLIDNDNPDHWIAQTDIGMQITENQGKSWTLSYGWVSPKFYYPDTDTVYGIFGAGSYSDGVYISYDNGYQWQVLKYMMEVTDLDLVNENPTTMYAIASGSIKRSFDGGLNWSSANGGISENNVKYLEINQEHPDTIYAITPSKAWKTDNGGNSWIELQGPFLEHSPVSLNIDPLNTEKIYIGANEVLIKSINGGTDWVVEDLPCSGLRTITLSHIYEGFIVAGFETDGVYISNDEGLNWTEMNEGLNNKIVNCISISPDSDFLLCGTQGNAIYKSDISFVGVEVDRNKDTKFLNIFPVPAKDKICININYDFESIEVYNIKGELQIISYETEFPISEFPSGIYFVIIHLANEHKTKTGKFIKL